MKVTFSAQLQEVEKSAGKLPKAQIELYSSKEVSATQYAAELMELVGNVIITIESAQTSIDDEEPEVAEGQQQIPTTDDGQAEGETVQVTVSAETGEILDDSPEDDNVPVAPDDPPTPEEAFEKNYGAIDDPLAVGEEVEEVGEDAEPTSADVEDAMFEDATGEVEEELVRYDLPPIDRCSAAIDSAISRGPESHAHFSHNNVHFTVKYLGEEKNQLKLTIGNAPDSDYAVTAAASFFAPLPVTSLKMNSARNEFTVSLSAYKDAVLAMM